MRRAFFTSPRLRGEDAERPRVRGSGRLCAVVCGVDELCPDGQRMLAVVAGGPQRWLAICDRY